MALPQTISSQGATVTFAVSAWSSNILGFSITGQERTVKSVTNIAEQAWKKYKPGLLVEPGTLEVQFQLDPDDPPPINADPQLITIQFVPPVGGTTGATYIGSGFIQEWDADMTGGDEEEASGSFIIKYDGDVPPVFTAST